MFVSNQLNDSPPWDPYNPLACDKLYTISFLLGAGRCLFLSHVFSFLFSCSLFLIHTQTGIDGSANTYTVTPDFVIPTHCPSCHLIEYPFQYRCDTEHWCHDGIEAPGAEHSKFLYGRKEIEFPHRHNEIWITAWIHADTCQSISGRSLSG